MSADFLFSGTFLLNGLLGLYFYLLDTTGIFQGSFGGIYLVFNLIQTVLQGITGVALIALGCKILK